MGFAQQCQEVLKCYKIVSPNWKYLMHFETRAEFCEAFEQVMLQSWK